MVELDIALTSNTSALKVRNIYLITEPTDVLQKYASGRVERTAEHNVKVFLRSCDVSSDAVGHQISTFRHSSSCHTPGTFFFHLYSNVQKFSTLLKRSTATIFTTHNPCKYFNDKCLNDDIQPNSTNKSTKFYIKHPFFLYQSKNASW